MRLAPGSVVRGRERNVGGRGGSKTENSKSLMDEVWIEKNLKRWQEMYERVVKLRIKY